MFYMNTHQFNANKKQFNIHLRCALEPLLFLVNWSRPKLPGCQNKEPRIQDI